MLQTPDGNYVAPEYKDLADRVTNGDGLNWPGDPRLWLGLGVLSDKKGRRKAHRLEVWRDNEDGSTALVGSWHPSDMFRIPFDLAQMRVESPGHVDVLDRIDKANADHQKKLSDQYEESMTTLLDHAHRLNHDRNNPSNRFYLNSKDAPGA